MSIAQWLSSLIPVPAGCEYIAYIISALLVVAIVVICLTMFCNMFTSIFRR